MSKSKPETTPRVQTAQEFNKAVENLLAAQAAESDSGVDEVHFILADLKPSKHSEEDEPPQCIEL